MAAANKLIFKIIRPGKYGIGAPAQKIPKRNKTMLMIIFTTVFILVFLLSYSFGLSVLPRF
jgi:hypothetical protein